MLEIGEVLKATAGKLISSVGMPDFSGFSIDSRTIRQRDLFIALKGNKFNGHCFIDEAVSKGAAGIIIDQKSNINPMKQAAVIEVEDTLKALGDIARFKRQKYNFPVVAVTGSAGKTTSKEMLAWVLSKNFNVLKNEGTKNNYIGLSLALLAAEKEHEIAVLELGTNHFGEIGALTQICRPNVGVITNIGPSHLEFFRNLDGVLREKWTLIRNLDKPFIAVLNNDDTLLKRKVLQIPPYLPFIKGRIEGEFRAGSDVNPVIFNFGMGEKSDFRASDINCRSERIEFVVDGRHRFRLNTVGYNNVYNALAAIAVARIFGMEYKDIAERLSDFVFPQSRLNLLKINNVRFVDDTYNSNPLSLKQALDSLGSLDVKGRRIFVMGDMLELGDTEKVFHSQAGRQIASTCSVFIAVGPLSKLTADTARLSGLDKRNIFLCDSSEDARKILFGKIAPKEEDIVLVKGSRRMKMEEIFKLKI